MPQRKVFEKSGTITADTQWDLDALDLSLCDSLTIEIELTANPTGTSPTLNVYLQNRFRYGDWDDRTSSQQFTSSHSSGERYEQHLQKFGTLSDSEEAGERSGSSTSRLTAGTVRNGPFPPLYRASSGVAHSWRVDFDAGGTSPSFGVKITVYGDSAV